MNNNHLKTDVAPANAENMETEVSAHTNLLESPDVSEASETSKHGAAAPRKGWLFRELFEWGETLISALIIIVVVFTFALRLTSVDGGSMLPTLKDEDQLLITNFFYTPKRGDIVVIYAPYLRNSELGKFETYGKDIIKRVIAVEGDVVEIDSYGHSGNVRLNGVVLDENYVSSQTYMNGLPIKVTVGKGQVFVLGDNRQSSIDSRANDPENYQGYVGLVDINHIGGKAFFRIWGNTDDWGGFRNLFGSLYE